MFSWLLVNIVLSALALLFVTLNASAPHRLRFLISFAALCAWLIPWQVVPEFFPQWQALNLPQIERSLVVNTAEYSLRPIVVVTTGLPLARDFFAFTWVELGFITLCATGLMLFSYHLCRDYVRLRHLRRKGECGISFLAKRGLTSPVPVIIQREIPGAFSSGLLTPAIWIHEQLATSTQLPTLLHHELTHIRQHDNWYLLFITFAEKLFWWNPLVRLVARQARELQELSCDVLCQQDSADYPLHLAELMIDNARLNPAQGSMLFSASIFNNTNLNIKRIKLLQRSYSMKPRHLVSTFVTAVSAIATIGIVTAQPEAGENQRTLIRAQSIQMSAEGSAGNVLFIARDPSQPITEGETAVLGFNTGTPAAMDQYIKMNRNGDETEISFAFTDTPLSMILEPIANMAAHDGMPAFGIASAMPAPGSAAGIHIVTHELVAGGTTTAIAGETADFYLPTPPNGTEPFDVPVQGVRVARVAEPFTMPLPSKLDIADEADRSKLVTVDAENVSVQEALEIIGAEANCNIFLEDDMIVVNSCAN